VILPDWSQPINVLHSFELNVCELQLLRHAGRKESGTMRSNLIRAAAVVAITGMATQAYASSCNNLVVDLQMPGWSIVGTFVGSDDCEHGEIASISPTEVTMTAAYLHGPDCNLTFAGPNPGDRAEVRFQQNYCAAAAGNITVESITGITPITRVKKGSWVSSRDGRILITGFE